MVVSTVHGAMNCFGNTAHLRFPVIDPAGQGSFRAEKVHLFVLRHLQPVEAVDEFAPAKDLPNESLHGVEWGLAVAVRLFRRLNAFQRREQAEIEKGGEDGVEEHGLALDHDVFPGAEGTEAEPDEVVEPSLRTLSGGGNPKVGRFAGVIWEKLGDFRGHVPNHGILAGRGEGGDRGFLLGELPEGAPVLVVEIPIAALRFALGRHQDVPFRAEPPVMVFHQQVLLAFGPGGKVVPRNEELGAAVGQDRDFQLSGELREGLLGIVLVGIEQVDLGDFPFLDPAAEHLRVVVRARSVTEAVVEDPVSGLFQGRSVVAHGRIQKGEFLLVVTE